MTFDAYTHNGDDILLRKLGLPTHAATDGDYAELGVVRRRAGGRDVRVEVSCLPAQFWRFTVGDVTLETGSGSFGDYWPIVEMIRDGMLVPEVVR